MLNNMISIAIITTCIGCGIHDAKIVDHRSGIELPYRYTMENHNPLFDQYAIGFPNRTKQIPIVFVEELKPAGICHRYTDGHSEIEIHKLYWDTLTFNEKRWLVWHELYHCEQRAGHNNKHIDIYTGTFCNSEDKSYECKEYMPLSIMRWYMPYPWQIEVMCRQSMIDAISKTYCDNLGPTNVQE